MAETQAPTTSAVYKVTIRGTIQQVWREITKTDEVQKVMFNMRLHTTGLKPGAPIRMRTPNGKYTLVVGEVLEFDPPRRYAHTFRFTQYDDPPCKIVYELREVPEGVEFTLRVEDVPAPTKTSKQMMQGNQMIVDSLKSMVETGRPTFGMRMLHRLGGLMQFLSPKRTRSENWPL
jgi:uncharacterized protein YndB with AHSA1/START domain